VKAKSIKLKAFLVLICIFCYAFLLSALRFLLLANINMIERSILKKRQQVFIYLSVVLLGAGQARPFYSNTKKASGD
jgi:hypothetical protein